MIIKLSSNVLIFLIIIILINIYAFSDEILQSKSYKIKFKSIEEVTNVVEPLLSQRGTITFQPRSKIITISDVKENLLEIEKILIDFDVPSPGIKMFFKLIYAEKKESSERISNLPDYIAKMKNIFQYTDYEVADEFLIESVEGDEPSFQIGKDYRIKYKVEYINDRKGMIQLRNFTLDRILRTKKEEEYSNLLSTTINLRDKETVIIGATKLEESPKALFIALTSQIKR